MTQLLFYALRDDLVSVLDLVESRARLQFVRMGIFPELRLERFERAIDIPDLGKATADNAIASDSFLVGLAGSQIHAEAVSPLDGKLHYSITQLLNPETVVFTPGGQRLPNVVLYGRIGTVSQSETSKMLMGLFGRAIKKQFQRVKTCYVGPSALAMLHAGWRLTMGLQCPHDFDLVEGSS